MTNFIKFICASLILILLFSGQLFAQKTEQYKDLKAQSDFVFEGKVIKSTGKWAKDQSLIYTEHEMLLAKVYKGKIQNSKVILITPGGIVDGQFSIVSHSLELTEGHEGIFFVEKRDFDFLKDEFLDDPVYFSNKMNSYVPKRFNDKSDIPSGYGVLQEKQKYDAILAEIGLPLREFDNENEVSFVKDPCEDITVETQAEIIVRNFQISAGFDSIEFDVMLRTLPDGLKLGKFEYEITFPTDIVGSFAIQNDLVHISKGDAINNSTNYLLSLTDEASNKIKVSVLPNVNINNLLELDGTEKQILHCAFPINNIADIKPDDFSSNGSIWYYCKRRLLEFDKVSVRTNGKEVFPNFANLNGVTFKMQKFSYETAGANQLLFFDIYATSEESRDLNSVELYINYNTTAFGEFVEDNNKVGVQTSGLETEDGYFKTVQDESSSVVRIQLEKAENAAPIFIGLVPKLIARVAFINPICEESAQISWNELTISGNNTYLEDGTVFQYMPINTIGELNAPMCGCQQDEPEIGSFSAPQVRAGTGEVLTIFGDHFGNVIVEGNSYIEVDNADHAFPNGSNPDWNDEDRTRIPIRDIIDWKNNEISFIVPSTTIGSLSAPMESGKVIVFNECGESNDKNMDVEYAVLNIRKGRKAYRVALERQTENGISFTFSNNIGGYEKSLAKNAIQTWCGSTNISWFWNSTEIDYEEVRPNDGINLIVEVDPSSSPFLSSAAHAGVVVSGEVSNTGNYISSCNNEKVFYVRNIDVVINEETNFSEAMTLGEARRIFKHEFGHGHLLQHANYLSFTQKKLMAYTSANFDITSADRNGAVSLFGASAEILSENDCPLPAPLPIQALGCSNAVDDIENINTIQVYPNPFSSSIDIDFRGGFLGNVKVKLYTVTGVLLIEKQISASEYTLSDMESLSNGMYLLQIEWGGFVSIVKLIKTLE